MFCGAVPLILFSAAILNLVYCDVYRLPNHIKPIRYYLTMEPHLCDNDTDLSPRLFEGSVTMELKVLENTKNITLNKVKLHIDKSSITIVDSKGRKVKIKGTSEDTLNETYTIEANDDLLKSETYNLTIGNFIGYLGQGEGFFEALYKKNGSSRSLAATHFEPATARKAFPCFDEPSFKARFIVSLIRKTGYTSVSNTNLQTTEDLGDGRFKDTFKETPIMPTFTLAFAVSDYKSSPKLERHRILARPDAIADGEWMFALDIANETLRALENYIGIDFALEKMDQIAIPDDFFSQYAMENWGLAVYGESHLLRNNESRAKDYKRTICIIAHEFSHQWFGNLVTPTWWDYLWLSESFATYFQFHIPELIQPSWRLKDQFLIDMVQAGLRQEEQLGAYSLNYEIEYSGEYPPFHIMYEKGGSIIRMMEHFLTHDVFRKGIQIYLEKNKFGNVVPSDLYSAFQQAVNTAGVSKLLNNISMAEILKTWDSNQGFPIVTATRNYQTGSITLQQKSMSINNQDTTTTKWIIPINYVFSDDNDLNFKKTTADYWLTEQNATINHKFPTKGWLLVNKQQTGYYRVNYDLENWKRILKLLNSENFTSIDVLNRAQLIDDAFNLAFNKQLPWEIPIRLGEYLVRERDYIPLASFYKAIFEYVDYFVLAFSETDNPKEFIYFYDYALTKNFSVDPLTEFEVYKDYIKTTLSGVNNSLGFEPKPDHTHMDHLHRSKFMEFYYFLVDN